MQTTHSTFQLAGMTVHQIVFDSATYSDADLLWLPHHTQFAHASRKRKTEHLAGRIAARFALKSLGIAGIPGRGINGEPLWPDNISGSISHSGNIALAIVSKNALTGIDCEAILDENEAREIKDGIIDSAEEALILQSGQPFSLALTLAFSAKESLFKALFSRVNAFMGFETACLTALTARTLQLTLRQPLAGFEKNHTFTLFWCRIDRAIVTVIA